MTPPLPAARRPAGHRLFFPLALVYGALAVPYWTAGWLGWSATGWTAAEHAHEMLFGFALAVVGGFLLTRPSPAALAVAVVAWVLGRVAVAIDPPAAVAAAMGLAFPAVLFVLAGVPFLRTARSGHNAVFGPLIGAFILAEALYRLAGDDGRTGVLLALHLVALLLFAMGGRIIPAATAGEMRRRDGPPVERVQPRAERIGLFGGIAAAATLAFGVWPVAGAAGAAAAGVCTLIRLAGWRPLRIRDRPELWSLHLGYAWLGIGWLAIAAERLFPGATGAAWHVPAIGALGTLACAMIVRATQQREAVPIRFPPAVTAAVLLISLSTAARAVAGWEGASPALPVLMAAAAATWSLALLLILASLRRILAGR
ncbi:NnrS family protein [Azospirillum halopraeferens]|uniref:NnrS family protein n=1 Tax=Azospirillum halopraeferens TaxID=34010 RepID=UPI0003F65292|nr:NnrS family protein [Azospirillum halopraeferens]